MELWHALSSIRVATHARSMHRRGLVVQLRTARAVQEASIVESVRRVELSACRNVDNKFKTCYAAVLLPRELGRKTSLHFLKQRFA